MHRPRLLVAAVCVLALFANGWLSAQAPAGSGSAAPTSERLSKWVRDLDDEDFALREEATRNLLHAETLALAPLHQAVKAPRSLELRRRAEAILRQLAVFEPGGEVVGGLKVRLALDREFAKVGDPVNFTATLANMTAQPMNLEVGFTTCGNYFECGSLLNRRDAKGSDAAPRWCVGFCGTGAKAILATIPPRSVIEYRLPAELVVKDGKLALSLGASKFSMHELDSTRPHSFRIVFKNQKMPRGGAPGGKYTPAAPAQPEAAYWVGTAVSNEVPLKIAR